jgi:hypothetical protein
MWALWSKPHSPSAFSANLKRTQEEKKTMGRRTLSMKEQLVGVIAALKSPRTPPQLKPSLKKRKETLEKALGEQSGKTKKLRSTSIFNI